MNIQKIQTNAPDDAPYGMEHDACAIYMSVRKGGESTFGTLKRSLAALAQMGHRTGFVNGEGDGAGVQTDIPRQLWAKKLSQANLRSSLATQSGFWVGHLFSPNGFDVSQLLDVLNLRFNDAGLNLLIAQLGRIRSNVLGQNARNNPPTFWQLAGYADLPDLENRLLHIQTQLETAHPFHFASLSNHTVVYKLRGSVETLSRYYPDLTDRNYDTSMVLCHARYSTNTVSVFERAQPFSLLGHNGEINTITRFCEEAEQIGTILPRSGSDSQNVDRTLHTLCVDHGLDLIEAMEMIFPPVPYELSLLPPEMRAVYTRLRQAFGPYAQGPAGVVARYGNTAVASVDALGLRPLWYVETEKEHIFSSERGATLFDNRVGDTRALAPGEKMALIINRGDGVGLLDHSQIRQHVLNKAFQREMPQLAQHYWGGWETGGDYPPPDTIISDFPPTGGSRAAVEAAPAVVASFTRAANLALVQPLAAKSLPWQETATPVSFDNRILIACGWHRDHVADLDELLTEKKAPVGSLGHDGPLAVMSKVRVNIADFYKETVAVVTNPAIDHQREGEAFSTHTLVGARPQVGKAAPADDILVELKIPLLPGGHPALGSSEASQEAAQQLGTLTIEQLLITFGGRAVHLTMGAASGEDVAGALNRLKEEAVVAVQSGAQCLVLDDFKTINEALGWIDPHLAVSAVDKALREQNLRRKAGIVVRSASLRNLHDLALLFGFGVDAVNPYGLIGVALKAHTNSLPDEEQQVKTQVDLLKMLNGELEKVISTMGCHELRGYGRVCSSIGLAPSVAVILGSPNFLGSEKIGLTWDVLNQEAQLRAANLRGEALTPHLPRVERFYPRFFKKVIQFVRDDISYQDLMNAFQQLATDSPVALRHIMRPKTVENQVDPSGVDISVNGYQLPFVIGAMSYGSQGETSFHSYIHAASALDIVCVNGEGGELPEIMGIYRRNRGQQVASARFGVNAEFLNSAAFLEIKIGQGAKPGEGGMLPGFKVTPKVALARRTSPYVTLLSPSNNHDLYSIEDLAQLIEELKNVNPKAKISVKCPVVPNIGVIAVGIAKAGADVINLSGYDGGTGAARKHALQYAGLPAEIGIIQAHRALVEAGIRHKVELWCDGGMKTAEDAFKMILLGANRVGFATMAMVALGCTICRQCNAGTCHVGIATHISSLIEAKEKGLKAFTPLEHERGTQQIVHLFTGFGEELRRLTALAGAERLQDLVGRSDLLEQVGLNNKVDLSPIFAHMPVRPRPEPEPGIGRLLTRPRNSLTRMMSELVLDILSEDDREVTYQDEVMAYDRALGSYLAGELIRTPQYRQKFDTIHLRFGPSSIAGNGFAAWVIDGIDILIEGGAQDGVAKGASGGRVAVMKGLNHDGYRIDGGVGKSFAYGAQGGVLIVQGDADSRACIRLSGASVILGGEITQPLDDSQGSIGTRANIKGFACEYMTAGRVAILGDPGPYAFAGMTGGVVYQMLTPGMGLDIQALHRRIAKGASITIERLELLDTGELRKLLNHYIDALEQTQQHEVAQRIRLLTQDHILLSRFVKIIPKTSAAS
jgi:glutamate synthase (NADPH) large chain